MNGANDLLTPSHIDAVGALIAQSKVLLTQLEIKLETTQRALQLAHEAGITR